MTRLAVALALGLFTTCRAEAGNTSALAPRQWCSGRGGCSCDCSWASASTCGGDDGSCCHACCCGSSPSPPPPAPGPKALYCPSASDLGGSGVRDQGWTIRGPGGAYTKAAFNVLGGYMEFDFDASGAHVGINNNFYTVSPDLGGGEYHHETQYCDGQAPQGKYCMELDVIEANGNCGGQTTLHTHYGHDGGCDCGGCQQNYRFGSETKMHIKAQWAENGEMTVQVGSTTVHQGSMSPVPSGDSTNTVAATLAKVGAVIVSTQWQGWVPRSDCGGGGDLYSSQFSVSNLRIYGSVVQGPQQKCSGEAHTNAPEIVV